MNDIPNLWYQSKAPLLLLGETGTGKSYLAKKIHQQSSFKQKKFLTAPLSTYCENLLESELFGHKRGAYTGAVQDHIGLCQMVEDGILFLDEIGELSLGAQKKLLYLLEERKYSPLGSCQEKTFYGKIVAATNVNLYQMVKEKKFREDLYYRLNVFSWHLSPIRENPKELDVLLNFYLKHYRSYYQRLGLELSPSCWQFLKIYPWPGNIRQLKNCMEYLCLQDKTLLEVEDLPSWIKNADSTLENALGLNNGLLDLRKVSTNYHLALGNFEKEYLRIALERRHGMVNQTAKELGLSKSTLIAKARKYGINVWLIKAGQQSRTGATLSLSA